jgi:lipopolysaccharide export system permease protein
VEKHAVHFECPADLKTAAEAAGFDWQTLLKNLGPVLILLIQSLLASPLLLLAMVLVAAVFSLKPNLRSGGILARVVGGVVTGFVFYFLSKVVYALGLSATLPAVLAAWAPTAVAGLFGSGALFHLEDG